MNRGRLDSSDGGCGEQPGKGPDTERSLSRSRGAISNQLARKTVTVHGSDKPTDKSPAKPASPGGPTRRVLPVRNESDRGRKPVLRDELAAVVLTSTYPRKRIRKTKRETRVTINKEFESFDSFINEYVTNISRSGAFVKSQQLLPIGTEINLRFAIIADSVMNIEGIGKVVRVETEPPGMGVVFTEINQPSRRLIERLLTSPQSADNKPAQSRRRY